MWKWAQGVRNFLLDARFASRICSTDLAIQRSAAVLYRDSRNRRWKRAIYAMIRDVVNATSSDPVVRCDLLLGVASFISDERDEDEDAAQLLSDYLLRGDCKPNARAAIATGIARFGGAPGICTVLALAERAHRNAATILAQSGNGWAKELSIAESVRQKAVLSSVPGFEDYQTLIHLFDEWSGRPCPHALVGAFLETRKVLHEFGFSDPELISFWPWLIEPDEANVAFVKPVFGEIYQACATAAQAAGEDSFLVATAYGDLVSKAYQALSRRYGTHGRKQKRRS